MSEFNVPKLLDAIVGVGRGVTLPDVLRKVVESSCDLVDARAGGFAVLGETGVIVDFVELGGHIRCGTPPSGDDVLAVEVHAGGTRFGTIYVADKRAGDFTEADRATLAMLASSAGVAIEHAKLFEQLRQRERWLSASYDVTSALLAGENPTATLRLVARRATVVAGGSAGAIALPREPDRTILVFDPVEPPGPDADRLTGLSVPIENTATGIAFTTREPVVVSDYGGHVTKQQSDHADRLPPIIQDLDSTIAVPLVAGDETMGVLVVARFRDKAPFTDAEVELARSFAVHAALAVKFARAEQDRRRLAVFEDRDRIARDLHDLVIQRLFATGLGLEGVSRLITNDQVATRVAGFAHDLDRTIRDIRNSIFSLQEPERASDSLRSELLRTVLDSAEILGFEPRLGFDGPLDSAVPDQVRSDLVASLREALSNVARHAAATRVSIDVDVDRTGRRLTLVVQDDGVGVPDRPSRRSGLANMDERAARWQGGCSVRPGETGGTRLTWTVVLPNGAERA